MKEKLLAFYLRQKLNALDAVENFLKEEKGASDIVAIVVIIVIILAVAVIFRKALEDGVTTVMDNFTDFIGG